MRNLIKGAIALTAIGGAMQAHADLVIDNFTIGAAGVNQFVSVNGANLSMGYSTSDLTTDVNILGGQRDIIIQKSISDSINKTVSAEVNITSNTFTFSQDTFTAGYSILRYDGSGTVATDAIDTAGLGSICVSCSAAGFFFQFGSDSNFPVTGDPFNITIDVWGAGGSSNTSFTETVPGTGGASNFQPGFVLLTEAAWTNPAFDWTDVSAFQITFNTGSPRAVEVDFAFTQPVGLLPEPASIALAGLALLGVGALRRRKA